MLHYPVEIRIEPLAAIARERLLPVEGKVLARVGDQVGPEDVIASAQTPGALRALDVAGRLGLEPDELPAVLRKAEGSAVEEGELLAVRRAGMGLFQASYRSPISGHIAAVADGRVVVRLAPRPLQLRAYLRGAVAAVMPRRGVVIEAAGALVEGVWGAGGEAAGPLKVIEGSSDAVGAGSASAVVVMGGALEEPMLRRAAEVGVRGIVAGSVDASLAGPVQEAGFPVVVTEGFGDLPMAPRALELLRALDGREAAISGAAGSPLEGRRPEVIVFGAASDAPPPAAPGFPQPLRPGDRVRGARAPHLGRTGVVTSLPSLPRRVETGARLWGAVVQFQEGEAEFVPTANLERIEAPEP